MGSINVWIRDASGNDEHVWFMHGDQGFDWKEAQITITSDSEYHVRKTI